MDDYDLKWENLIGYGSDGASVVSGCNNSVWTRLKSKNPNVMRFTCICHSLAKVAEDSFDQLPSRMSALLSFIPKWFKKSEKRKQQFLSLFDQLCPSEMPESNPFERYSETRWLCRAKVIKNILENWDVQVKYFEEILPDLKRENKFKVSIILENLKDEELKKLFVFASPIMQELEAKNKYFQAEFIDPLKAIEEIRFLTASIEQRLYGYQAQALPTDKIDFGFKFLSANPSIQSLERAKNF